MLKKLKIKSSLLLVVGITVGLSLLIIIFSLMALNTQREEYEEMIATTIAAKRQVDRCRLDLNIMVRRLNEAVLTDNESKLDECIARYHSVSDGFDEELQKLVDLYPFEDGNDQAYADALRKWLQASPNVITLLKSGERMEATNYINSELAPISDPTSAIAQKMSTALDDLESSAKKHQHEKGVKIAIALIAITVAATAFVLLLAIKIIKGIVAPLHEVVIALDGYSQGNLSIPVTFESENEIGEMCSSVRKSQEVLRGLIADVDHLLSDMADGNFATRSRNTGVYVGELESILESIRKINRSLSDAIQDLTHSAEQVSAGSDQVSAGAQSLAQGATEQASSVEELSATLEEISRHSKANASNSSLAMEHTHAASDMLIESSTHMEEMVRAMDKISDSSKQIGKIIATIENIAFKTNILALNAAVEAARAGSAGKGFAVVANEVRNLASQSDEAAKATKALIQDSVTSVEEGNNIVQNVVSALQKTKELTEQTVSDVSLVADAAVKEADSIAQISQGIDQIASVVQTNSASSEEFAAASEEVSGQMAVAKGILDRFTLANSDGSAPRYTSTDYDAPVSQGEFVDSGSKY